MQLDKSCAFLTRCAQRRILKQPVTRRLSTVDDGEVQRFRKLSHKWWDETGEYAALHSMNKLRVPLVKGCLEKPGASPSALPLRGSRILDVGCGGGILSEALARLGADVLGLDATAENIESASERLSLISEPLRLRYSCSTVEDLEEEFDLVVASEVIEHVSSLDMFLDACVSCTKPGGQLVFTTLNRTQLSYWLAIFAAERIAGVVPPGTHDWGKFVKPEKLKEIMAKCKRKGNESNPSVVDLVRQT